MATIQADDLKALYLQDETAWLDISASLIREGRLDELDFFNLCEFLEDMARRDRREVESRLVLLIAHVLKWVHQPDHRSKSWRVTIVEQQQELTEDVASGVLRNHAEAVLHAVYQRAVRRAAAETDLPAVTFPTECPCTVEQLLKFDPIEAI